MKLMDFFLIKMQGINSSKSEKWGIISLNYINYLIHGRNEMQLRYKCKRKIHGKDTLDRCRSVQFRKSIFPIHTKFEIDEPNRH